MKKNLGLVLLSCALVLSGLGFSQSPPQETDPKLERIDRLERDLVDSRARAEAIAAELAATRALLADVVGYLADQSQSAKSLAETLDASEAAGFTFGINPESRHILLRGWREHLATLQQPVVVPPAPKPAGAKSQTPNGG